MKAKQLTIIKTEALQYFSELQNILNLLDLDSISKCIEAMWHAYLKEHNIFFIGNGGSASTATHIAADIGKNTVVNHKNLKEKRFHTIALTDNPAWIMSLGNDISYEDIFLEQLKNHASFGDILVTISGSGNSANILKAAKYAKQIGVTIIGFTGFDGGKLAGLSDIHIHVPVNHYGYIEGVHSEIHHFIVEALKKLKRDESKKALT